MFTSSPQNYDRNIKDAEKFTAGPAHLDTPTGGREPGVILWNGATIRAVLPVPEALRLANEIADALTIHRKYATN